MDGPGGGYGGLRVVAYLVALNALLRGNRAPWHFEPLPSVEEAEAALDLDELCAAQDAYVEAYRAVYGVDPFHPYPQGAKALWEATAALAALPPWEPNPNP